MYTTKKITNRTLLQTLKSELERFEQYVASIDANNADEELMLAHAHMCMALGKFKARFSLFDSPEEVHAAFKSRFATDAHAQSFGAAFRRFNSTLMTLVEPNPVASAPSGFHKLLTKQLEQNSLFAKAENLSRVSRIDDTYSYNHNRYSMPRLFEAIDIGQLLEAFLLDKVLFDSASTNKHEGILRLYLLSPCLIVYRDELLVSRPPKFALSDMLGRIHATDQPAVVFPNNDKVAAISGIRVDTKIFSKGHRIKLSDIRREQNMEVRRVLIERFGIDRYLGGIKAKVTSADDYGTLYHAPSDAPRWWEEREELAYVKLLNSTPEPGTTDDYKEYLLRVPPNMKTPQEAVAWSFQIDQEAYEPMVQT